MKLKTLIINSLLALGLVAVVRAQEIKFPGKVDTPAPASSSPSIANPSPATPAAIAAQTYTEAQILETIGWFMGKNAQADTFDFTREQIDSVTRGFSTAISGKPAPYELKQIGPQVQSWVTAKQDSYLAKLKAKGMAESAAFLSEVKKKSGVVVLPSGLCYEIIKQGEGPAPKLTDTVKAHYTGSLVNGTVFDSSIERKEPVEFPLDQVIPGWTEGLQKISKGGKIKLYVPPQLAYGDDGRPSIPPASTLIFEIEIIDIKPTPPAAIPSAAPAK